MPETNQPIVPITFGSRRKAISACALMGVAALATWQLTPTTQLVKAGTALDVAVPKRFGDWTEVPSALLQVNLTADRDGERTMDQPYDDTLMRTYRNSKGEAVMLAIAYGRSQRQEVKIHRPDLCYVAQGFDVDHPSSTRLAGIASAQTPVTAKRMIAQRRGRMEAVSYWMRVGNLFSEDSVSTRIHILKEGLAGRIPDGVVVRVSALIGDAREAAQVFPLLERFLGEMVGSVSDVDRRLLVG